MKVQIVNKSSNPLPSYATAKSAGADLRANLKMPVILHPNEQLIIPTGIHIALPEGYEAQIRPRSGLAAKYGITIPNAPGTIDADYRGEIGVILKNTSNTAFVINNGDRIAQIVFAKCETADFETVETLDETERGEGAYGHTGVQ